MVCFVFGLSIDNQTSIDDSYVIFLVFAEVFILMFPSDNDLDFKITMESDAIPFSKDIPFHILLLGDWSGRENRVHPEQCESVSQLFEIDRDNFDEVLGKLNVRLDLEIDGNGQNILSLRFAELDDFHPDKIFEQVSIFSDLRDLRRRLSKSETFEKAANEVRLWFETDDKNLSQNQTQTQEPAKTYSSPADLLDNILSQPDQITSPAPTQIAESTELNLLISKVVKPFLVNTDENEQSRLIAAVDEATSDLMRKILHHPHFKNLESAWRGLYYLVRAVETDLQLKIFLLDITKSELSLNLKSADNSQNFSIYKILESSGNWALICGNYSFQVNVNDIALLIRLAKISNSINAPFISYLKPKTIDNTSIMEISDFNNLVFPKDSPEANLWNTIRSEPEADSIGLLIQQLLIRMPYGKDTEPTENFSFEEFSTTAKHNDYLWTNPCFACALLLAHSYSVNGWEMGQSLYLEIEGIPSLLFDDAGMSKILPGSEFVMTESLCEDILQSGLMPIISFRNSHKIRLARFQSISFLNNRLKGKWN